MILYSHANKAHLHNESFGLSLVVRVSFWKLEMTYRVETKQLVSPVFSLSFGMTVTIKLAMAATTKPITTTFFRPNLTKKSDKNC